MISKKDILSCLGPVKTDIPYSFGDRTVQLASVLLIIHHNYEIPHILFTKRSSALTLHPGEISFPGGKFVIGDHVLQHTALRETKEELGLDFSEEEISGSLEAVKTLTSNYMIVPYITLKDKIPKPKVLFSEVEKVLDVPLEAVLKTITPDKAHGYLSDNNNFKFKYKKEVIWGATARILKQLHDRLHI